MKTALVKSIVSLLEKDGHYVSRPSRLVIDEVSFPCDAALLGPTDEHGQIREHLVVVQAAGPQETLAVYDQIQALTMILARTGSQRPLTLVLVTTSPTDPALNDFANLCRVIVVPADGINDVSVPLRELLPLKLPPADQVTTSPETRLKHQLGKRASDPLVSALLHAAKTSDEAVEKCMRDWLVQAIEQDSSIPPK